MPDARYPPGGAVPVLLKDSSAPIRRYLRDTSSNTQMISFSVWLDSSAETSMPHTTHAIPPFIYAPEKPSTPRRERAGTMSTISIESSNGSESDTSKGTEKSVPASPRLTKLRVKEESASSSRPKLHHSLSSSAIFTRAAGLGITLPRQPTPGASESPRSTPIAVPEVSEPIPDLSYSQKSTALSPEFLRTPEQVENNITWFSPPSRKVETAQVAW